MCFIGGGAEGPASNNTIWLIGEKLWCEISSPISGKGVEKNRFAYRGLEKMDKNYCKSGQKVEDANWGER